MNGIFDRAFHICSVIQAQFLTEYLRDVILELNVLS